MLRRLALAGVAVLLVGCDPGVTSPTPQSITITGSSSLSNKNETSQLTATIQDSNASTRDVTAAATWATSSPDVASVSSGGLATAGGGLVTALANGTTNITATAEGKSNTFLITVAMKATPEVLFTGGGSLPPNYIL